MILAHEQDDTERYFLLSPGSMMQAKMNSYFNLLVYSLICI